MLYIRRVNTDIEKEWEFVRNMPEDENGLTNSWNGISRQEFEEKALPDMLRFSKGENLPDWMVPETFLFLWNDGTIVGQFRIRHYLNDALRAGAGHIGYFIAKEFRGKGFGAEGLKLTLDIARTIVPEDEFYLRVNRNNPASLKVMMKNGGHIVAEDEAKYYVRIKNPGKGLPTIEIAQ
ncbi:MAG: GNAT family N-acetyltransferase [Acetatifactor sp.]|nr:GNAT family N-acetyltransferase [Acetatifactor sp.]